MTGKDLITYILDNGLVNVDLNTSDLFIGYISEDLLAIKYNVGVETIKAWNKLGDMPGFYHMGKFYALSNTADPRRKNDKNITNEYDGSNGSNKRD